MSVHAHRSIRHLSITWVIVSFLTAIASAQPADPHTRRVRGVIDTDETWAGHILITDHLTILNAVVTVQPGTRIEFAHAVPGSHPILSVGSADRERGELRLLSKPDQPIVFRSRENTNPGRIIYFVRDRLVSPPARSTPPNRPPPAPFLEPARIDWRNIRFENLGHPRQNRARISKRLRFEPALSFILSGHPHTIRITDCTFENTGPLEARCNPKAEITLERNRFRDPRHRIALMIMGSPIGESPAAVNVVSNTLAAALRLEAAPATLRDNILIGPNAAIVIRDDSSKRTALIGNYVHNTTKTDDGHYCLDTHNPDAAILNNVFRGGTTCVLNGARRMAGNVFIGAESLRSKYVRQSHTHQCVAALPAGSVFERNLLIGPAHALLIPQPHQTRADRDAAGSLTHIRHNVFIGAGNGTRAIHLNPIGHAPVRVSAANNLFLGLSTLFFDEGGTNGSLIYADHNAAAPPPSRPFERTRVEDRSPGEPGWAARDIRRNHVSDLGLNNHPFDRTRNYDQSLLSGVLSIDRLRAELFSTCQPRATSPLIGAGRPPADNARAARPAIGALEPGWRLPPPPGSPPKPTRNTPNQG